MTTVLGIDPGISGGLAWNSKGEGVQAVPMPHEEADVVKLLRDIITANQDNHIIAYMELVTGYVVKDRGDLCHTCGQPKAKGEPGSRMFTFGHGAGNIAGALRMAGIEIELVSPRTWQKPFYVNLASPDGQRRGKADRKRILRDVAQRLFMTLEVTLKTADALLIHAHGVAMIGQEFEGMELHSRPELPVPFIQTHKKQFEKLKKKVTGKNSLVNGKDPFAIAEWAGVPYVMALNHNGNYSMIRPASEMDVMQLPKVSA